MPRPAPRIASFALGALVIGGSLVVHRVMHRFHLDEIDQPPILKPESELE